MTTMLSDVDFASSGLDVQAAMVRAVKSYGKKIDGSCGILWNGRVVLGGDRIPCGKRGLVRLELLHFSEDVEQGVDLKVDGYFELLHGEKVPLLRTWADARYEDVVEYPYFSKSGLIHVWNVFKRRFPNGQTLEDRWTGNAGFWIEELSPTDRIYHCSHGMADAPDFEALRFRVSVFPQ